MVLEQIANLSVINLIWGFESLSLRYIKLLYIKLLNKKIWVGRIVAIAAGCKPAVFGYRWFKSNPAHLIKIRMYSSVGRARDF